jgi:hypothetical protein
MIRDNPYPGENVPSCLSANAEKPSACAYSRESHTGRDAPLYQQELRARPPGDVVHYVDFTDAICPSDPCPVISPRGAVIFQDSHHLTATFARELTGTVERALRPYIG